MTLLWYFEAPKPNSITLCISSAPLTKTTSSQLYGKTTNESINKINGSVWGHVPHQLISGITSPSCSCQAQGGYEESARLELEEGEEANQKEKERRSFLALWCPPPHWSLGCYSLLSILQGQRFCVFVSMPKYVYNSTYVKYNGHTTGAHSSSHRINILRIKTPIYTDLSFNMPLPYLQILTIHLHCLQSVAAWFT